MDIKDAARICYGDKIAEDCARHEDEKQARQTAYDEFYHIEWQAIPSRFKGSLLLEAISELAMGEDDDDAIVAAYAAGDREAAAEALFTLLDRYRGTLADRASEAQCGG